MSSDRRRARGSWEGHACLDDVACVAECPGGEDLSWLSYQEPPEGYWPDAAEEERADRDSVYLPDPVASPELLKAHAIRAFRAEEAAARDKLVIALAWAHRHPALDKFGVEKPWQAGRRPTTPSRLGAHALSHLDAELAEAIARVEARVDDGQITSEQAERQVADLTEWHGIPAVAWDARPVSPRRCG